MVAMNVDRLVIRPEDEDIVDEIRNLLQMAEDSIIDKLSETRGKLSFIDSDGVVKSRMDDSFLRKFDISRDMNDADIDHYEEIVNDLADKLEKLNAEKSDLQLISSALGERLQRLGKEKEEALQSSTASFEKERQFFQSRIADLESQLKKMEVARLDYSLDVNDSIIDPSMAPQRKILEQYMKNQLDLNAEEIEQYEQMINSLVKKIDSNEEEIVMWKQTCDELKQQSSVLKSDFDSLQRELQKFKLDGEGAHKQKDLVQGYSLLLENFVTSVIGVLAVDFEMSSLPPPSVHCIQKWDSTALDALLSRIQSVKSVILSNSVPRVEFDKAQIRLEAKLSQIDDMAAEIGKLQSSLDAAEKELDQYKMSEMKSVATNRLMQLDKDNELEILRSRVLDLEEKGGVLQEEVESLEQQLAEALGQKNSLTIVLERLQSKEAATEELLVEIQDKCKLLLDENDELHQELARAGEQLISTSAAASGESIQEVTSLRESYELKVAELKRIIDQQANLLSESTASIGQLKSELLDCKQRSRGFELESEDLRRMLQQSGSLTSPLTEIACNAISMGQSLEIFYQDGLDSALRHLEMKVASAEGCVQDLKSVLAAREVLSSEDFRERMIETQKALNRALVMHDEDVEEKEHLLVKVQELEDELERIRSAQFLDVSLETQLRDQEENVLRLKRLLVAAERRVSSSATEQAQKFAQSARIIGYLESECFRLHGLCDYFKAANAKLTGELKRALTNSIRQQHAEHIAVTLTEQKDATEEKLDQLSVALSVTRNEHVQEMRRVENDYNIQLMKLNSDLESMFTQLSMKETETAELQTVFKASQVQYTEIERNLREEVATLKANFTESEKRRISLARDLSEKDTELNELLGKLRETTMQVTQLDERQKLLVQDSEVKQALDEQSKADLAQELQDGKTRIAELESKLSVVTAKLNARDEALVKQEAEVTDHVLRASMLSDENSGLTEAIKLLREQVAVAAQERDAKGEQVVGLNMKVQKLEQQIATITISLSEYENLCRQKDEQLLELREEIEKFSASVGALEMRDKFNSDELNNAGQVIAELRLEVEALRSLLDTATGDRRDLQTALDDHKEVVGKLQDALTRTQDELDQSELRLKKCKVELREALEQHAVAEEALEGWLQLRFRLVEHLREMLVVWETRAIPGVLSVDVISQLRELLPQLLGDGSALPSPSIWTQYLQHMQELVDSGLEVCRSKIEEMEIFLHGAQLQTTAVEDSLRSCQSELRQFSEIQMKYQALEEARLSLQHTLDSERQQLAEARQAQQSLASRVITARQRILVLAAQSGLVHPASMSVSSATLNSGSVDAFHREIGEFEDIVVSLVAFLDNRSTELQTVVRDLEDRHGDANGRLQQLLLEKDEENSQLVQRSQLQADELHRVQKELLSVSQLLDVAMADNELLHETEVQLQQSTEQLRRSLQHAEEVAVQLQNERDELLRATSANDQDVRALETELDLFRRRIKACELQLESTAGSNQRLKAERDALESLNLSMKLELERVRLEQSSLAQAKTLTDSLPHLLVEFDRLLITTDSVLAAASMDSDLLSNNASALVAVEETTLVSKIQQYSSRVNRSVTSLNKLSLVHREEKKRLRQAEEQVSRLKSEAASQKDLIAQLNSDLRGKNEELANLLMQPRSTQEIEKLDSIIKSLERDCKETKAQLAEATKVLDNQQKSASRLQLEVSAKSDEVSSLRRQLQAMKTSLQLESAQREAEANKNVRSDEELESLLLQLDASRQNCDKLSISVRHLEASLAQERGLRHSAESRVADMTASFSRLQQIDLSFQAMQREKDGLQTANQSLIESNAQLNEKMKLLQSEVDLSKRRVQSLEMRLQSVLSDRDSFLQKISETQAMMHQANLQSVRERNAPVEKPENTGSINSLSNSMALVAANSDQTRDLKLLVDTLTTEVEEKEAKLAVEKKRRIAQERELESLKLVQTRLQEECDRLRSYSSSFRTEGRETRKEVLELCGAICEMTVQMRMDLQLSPATKALYLMDDKHGHSMGISLDASNINSEQPLKLNEALGVQELMSATKSLRETFSQLRDEWRRMRQREDDLTLAEMEVNRLRRQLEDCEAVKQTLSGRHADDVKYWQQKYSDLQALSTNSVQQKKRVTELERILSHEQSLKEQAILEVEQLREQIEKLQSVSVEGGNTSIVNNGDVSQLLNELEAARQRLAVTIEGNSALQATVQHLENRLMQSQPAQTSSPNNTVPCQQQASEIIVSLYRSILFSFTDGLGLSVDSQPFQGQYHAVIETVDQLVHALRKYYDEEIDFLNGKLNSLFQQYREAKVYGGELSRQLEDQVKALFRSGKGSISEFMMKEREKLKLEVERVQQDLLETEQQLLEDQEKMRAKISRMSLDVVQLIKDRDEAAASVLSLEKLCLSRGVDIGINTLHQKLIQKFWRPANDQSRNGRSELAAKKTIDTLMRGLLEADHELFEAERKAKVSTDARRTVEEPRKLVNETFLVSQHPRNTGLVYDLQTMDKGKGSSSLRISKSKR
jgi:chromosome segregation ATPase